MGNKKINILINLQKWGGAITLQLKFTVAQHCGHGFNSPVAELKFFKTNSKTDLDSQVVQSKLPLGTRKDIMEREGRWHDVDHITQLLPTALQKYKYQHHIPNMHTMRKTYFTWPICMIKKKTELVSRILGSIETVSVASRTHSAVNIRI